MVVNIEQPVRNADVVRETASDVRGQDRSAIGHDGKSKQELPHVVVGGVHCEAQRLTCLGQVRAETRHLNKQARIRRVRHGHHQEGTLRVAVMHGPSMDPGSPLGRPLPPASHSAAR